MSFKNKLEIGSLLIRKESKNNRALTCRDIPRQLGRWTSNPCHHLGPHWGVSSAACNRKCACSGWNSQEHWGRRRGRHSCVPQAHIRPHLRGEGPSYRKGKTRRWEGDAAPPQGLGLIEIGLQVRSGETWCCSPGKIKDPLSGARCVASIPGASTFTQCPRKNPKAQQARLPAALGNGLKSQHERLKGDAKSTCPTHETDIIAYVNYNWKINLKKSNCPNAHAPSLKQDVLLNQHVPSSVSSASPW